MKTDDDLPTLRHLRLLWRILAGECPRASYAEFADLMRVGVDGLQLESAFAADRSGGNIITALMSVQNTEAAVRDWLTRNGYPLVEPVRSKLAALKVRASATKALRARAAEGSMVAFRELEKRKLLAADAERRRPVYIIHGWRLDVESTRKAVRDEKTFKVHLRAASTTACGRRFGSTFREPCALGPKKVVTCVKCLKRGCR